MKDLNKSLNQESETLTLDELKERVTSGELTLFTAKDVKSYIDDSLQKAEGVTGTEREEVIEKAKKNLSKLVKKTITDKKGKKTTVWVKQNRGKEYSENIYEGSEGSEGSSTRPGEGNKKVNYESFAKDIVEEFYGGKLEEQSKSDIKHGNKHLKIISSLLEKFHDDNPDVKFNKRFVNELVNEDIDEVEEKYGKLHGFTKLQNKLADFYDSAESGAAHSMEENN